ncbi:hypothetical protein LLEC1_05791 [Akanthomyces lecanii]|uniref:Uncharacterized protein n=1 Tax=Cordyceps confragosa TaxID=2714763 RepID=A0A179I097_CORDF|nr:hypothetical protein LLEC1_05791 [Akanthomyces lecanii]
MDPQPLQRLVVDVQLHHGIGAGRWTDFEHCYYLLRHNVPRSFCAAVNTLDATYTAILKTVPENGTFGPATW